MYMCTVSHTQMDRRPTSVYFPLVPWCLEIGQAYNQLVVLSSRGCQLAFPVIGYMTSFVAEPASRLYLLHCLQLIT